MIFQTAWIEVTVKMIQFEVLLNDLGEIGVAQILIILLLSYFNISGGINSLATVFTAYEPDYRCNVPPLDNATAYPNLTESDILNLTTPYDPASNSYDRCYRYGFNLTLCDGDTSCSNTSYPPISCDQGYYYDRSLFKETVITEFDLICKRDYLNALSTSLYYAGLMIGSVVFGNFADIVGRKLCCIVNAIGLLAFMIGTAFCRSLEAYMVCRVFLAIFVYGANIGTYVYIIEVVGKKWRTVAGLGSGIFFPIGYMILSGVAYNWRDWHNIMLVSTYLSIPFLIFSFIIPESPRWLLTKKKEKQGIEVVEKMARINKVVITDETWEEARRVGEETEKNLKIKEKTYSTIDLFRTKATAFLTLKVTFNWFVNSFVYYGITLNAGALAGDVFVNNTLNGVFEIAASLFCILVLNRIGRKIALTFLLLLAGVALVVSAVFNTYANDNEALIMLGLVFAFVSKFGISGSFSVIYILTTELYPTVIRSNGVAIGSVAGRVGGIIAPFLIDLQDIYSWLPSVIFGVFCIVAGVLSMTFPETNGQEMKETIEEAEKFYRGEHLKYEIKDDESNQDKENKEEVFDELPNYSHVNQAFEKERTQM